MPFWKQLSFYLICGFGGYLFGGCCDTDGFLFVGCQPAVCGFIGGMAANLIVNFHAMHQLGGMRFCFLALIFGVFILVLLYTMPAWDVLTNGFKPADPLAQLGGLLTGLFVGLAMMPRVRRVAAHPGSYEKKLSLVGLGLCGLMWGILLTCFYLAATYPRILNYEGTLG